MAIGFPEFFVLFCAQFLALTDVKKKKIIIVAHCSTQHTV